MDHDLTEQHRLAVYGTLAPGRPNHHQLDGVGGRWFPGVVRGQLVEAGWGATLGYPALVLDLTGADPAASEVPVLVLESADLAEHWARLDAFEGSGYVRVATTVSTDAGDTEAFIYTSAAPLG